MENLNENRKDEELVYGKVEDHGKWDLLYEQIYLSLIREFDKENVVKKGKNDVN